LQTELSTTGGTSDGRFIATHLPAGHGVRPDQRKSSTRSMNMCWWLDMEPLKNIYKGVLERSGRRHDAPSLRCCRWSEQSANAVRAAGI
jgi:hypothetical protein